MIGGTLSNGSYFFGGKLIPPRAANPKGFFESGVVNNVNERILKTKMPLLQYGHRWLGLLGLQGVQGLYNSGKIVQEIKALVSKQPFCYKDPRFCYTLPIWRPHLKNTKFICIFRHPKNTVASILKECVTAPYLKNMKITKKKAQNVWRLMYTHVVERHRKQGQWLFIHYDQMFSITTLHKIEEFLQTEVNKTFPEKKLRRPMDINIKLSPETQRVYRTLCNLASYNEE
jgi:hypothetical protein